MTTASPIKCHLRKTPDGEFVTLVMREVDGVAQVLTADGEWVEVGPAGSMFALPDGWPLATTYFGYPFTRVEAAVPTGLEWATR